MTEWLQTLIARDFSDIAGARASVAVPLRGKFLNEAANEWVRERRGPVREFDIQIGADNFLEIGIKAAIGPFTHWFRPELILARAMDPRDGSSVVVTLASTGYAAVARLLDSFVAGLLPPWIRMDGADIVIDWRAAPLSRFIESARMTTTPGILKLDLALKVDRNEKLD